VIASYGAVPGDWSWWAASAIDDTDTDDDVYDVPFEDVRARLANAGITVAGLPSDE